MNTHEDRTPDHQSQARANHEPQVQSESTINLGFVDSRPEMLAQRKLKELVDQHTLQKKSIILTAQHSVQNISKATIDRTSLKPFQLKHDQESSESTLPTKKLKPFRPKPNHMGLPDKLKSGVESLSGYSMDDVKVHYNSQKPTQLNAHAYAQGTDIHVAPGQEKHLPHEAWHVVQQKQGRVKPTMQMKGNVNINDNRGLEREADVMGGKAIQNQREREKVLRINKNQQGEGSLTQFRRMPSGAEGGGMENVLTDYQIVPPNLLATDPVNAVNYAAHSGGVNRLIARAERELKPPQLLQVNNLQLLPDQIPLRPLTQAEFDALPERERLLKRVRAIQTVAPHLVLGDPALIDTGSRPGTADDANLQTLVNNANAIFDNIASGAQDTSIGQIFGVANVATAKAKYAQAKIWLNTLHTNNRIVSDRSGYSAEVNLGGLTGYHSQIALSPHTIDNPADNESVVTCIHESMHAGNNDVGDHGYIHQAAFTQLPEATKLNNAAHFEVVPRRILGAAHNFSGQTFVPAGTVGAGGVVAPPLTDTENAIRQASETFRAAWTVALNLHTLFVDTYKTPALWTQNPNPKGGAVPYSNCLPFWSKVEKMTVHEKTTINPASTNVSERPFSTIDIALSEGLIRKLAIGMGAIQMSEAQARTFEQANSTSLERISVFFPLAGAVERERDFLIKLVLEHRIGSITGNTDRDFRMVNRLAQANTGTYNDMLTARGPDAFPD